MPSVADRNDPARRPSVTELAAAANAVAENLPPTPLLATSLADRAWLKLETAQPTGSFKVRGALAAITASPRDSRIITASAGNHGLGMAFGATALERQVTVVVPRNASPTKLAALETFPVELVRHGEACHEAEIHGVSLARDPGEYVSPYNNAHVIAGQATIGNELDLQLGNRPLTVVCGVGGGGLCAGLSLWSSTRDNVRIVGVEASASRAVSTAIDSGHVIEINVESSLADGLVGQIDDRSVTWQIIRDHADGLVDVTEDEIRSAMRWLFREHGLVVEGSGAVGVAAVLNDKVDIQGDLVITLSGRNITPSLYAEVLLDA